MNLWLIALILAAADDAPRVPRGETVFAARFDESSDTNFDGWPDGWTRRRGEGYPQYLAIGIAEDPDQPERRCLRIALDGGAASLLSTPIPIDPRFSFELTGRIKTRQLRHDVVHYSLTFFDAEQQQKETYQSQPLTRAPDWVDVQIGPARPTNPDVRYAVLGVHVAPTAQADLVGMALFCDVSLTRHPYMVLATNQPLNLFRDPTEVAIDYSVAGLPERELTVRLELLDVFGVVHDTTERALAPDAAGSAQVAGTTPAPTTDPAVPLGLAGWQRAVTWRPHVPAPGHYTVRGTLQMRGAGIWQQTVELAVARPGRRPNRTEFAWSLPDTRFGLTTRQLVTLLRQAQVGWLKAPLVADAGSPAGLESAAQLAESLSAEGIQLVGVLGPPAADPPPGAERGASPRARDWFRVPAQWQPACDPLLDRLGLAVPYWQLGADGDDSFADDPASVELIRGVRDHWRRAGYFLRLGVAWPWLHPVPRGAAPWDFLVRSEPLPFTATELGQYATAAAGDAAAQWVTLEPLPAADYPAAARARDLVLRMVAAKQQGLAVIAAHDPLDDDHGLVHRDGTPTALFLPWCVTAEQLGGAKYLGSLTLPCGSPNQVFEQPDGAAVMVLWNNHTVTETVYAGEAVQQVDLWGRAAPASAAEAGGPGARSVEAGPVPVFLTGLDLPLVLWQLRCSVTPTRLARTDMAPLTVQLVAENTFPCDVDGTWALRAPASWSVRGGAQPLQLAEHEAATQELVVRLHPDTDQGRHRIAIDFDLLADRRYQFPVYRELEVGTGDLLLALDCWLDAAGQLMVEQRVTNTTASLVSVNCYLQAPGRRRLRHQILDLPRGHALHTYTLPDGAALAGRTVVLRVEEIRGSRQWNCRTRVTLAGAQGEPTQADDADARRAGRLPRSPRDAVLLELPVERSPADAQ